MRLDVLCPHTWQDSYESCMISETLWNVEVSSLHDVLLLLHTYFSSEDGKREIELWGRKSSFGVYLDCELIGDYCDGNLIIFPITDYQHVGDRICYTYRHGNEGFILPVETCLQYGINRRTVRRDDTHVWR